MCIFQWYVSLPNIPIKQEQDVDPCNSIRL